MPDFSVDDNGEWTFVDGDFVVIEGAEEVRQDIRTVLQISKGEVQFDAGAGVDTELVFAAGATLEDVAGEYRDVILGRPGVTVVETPVLADKGGRTIEIHYTAQYSFDDLTVRGSIADNLTLKT